MEEKFKEFSPEQINGALACKTVEELIEFGKKNGIELTEEKAKDYLAFMQDFDVQITDEDMKNVAGGGNCAGHCMINKWP